MFLKRKKEQAMEPRKEERPAETVSEPAPALPEPDEAALEAQLRAIREIDPAVRAPEDLLRGGDTEALRGYLRLGLDLKDAYFLANRERLLAQAAARRSAEELQAGKAHLKASVSRGEGAPTVPAGEAALYRQLMPGLSEAEIRRHYGEDRKKYGSR